MTTAQQSEFQIAQKKPKKNQIRMHLLTHLTVFFFSNIWKLMNAFNYPENNITESNYDEVLAHLNHTNPEIIQGLHLETCDLQAFLSQVSG